MSTFLSILPIIIALVLYFTGIPIAYALFAAALTYFGFIDTTTVPCLLMQKFITSTQSFPFLAIPFFIMCGSIMNYGGISARLMDFADALTGHLPGGLAQINVLLSMLMGGCSGSANADAAMECKLLVPEMEKRGYGKGFSAAITAASSCVTPIIPPGINLIVYGLIAGASVGQLFAAGYVPGLLMAVTLMIAVAIIAKKRGYAPSRPRRATLGEIGRQALKSFWALFFPLGIIMGMRFGIFTPTEAGGVGVLYCLIVGKFVYKGLKKEHFIPILRETISGTATVMLIIVSATVFGYYLNWENIPTMLLNAVTSFASNKFLVLLVMNVVLLIVGMFLEGGAALILEEYEHAKARGAKIYAEIVGYGSTCDAHHVTAPAEEAIASGKAIVNAMAGLEGVKPEEIYINAHGTGTALNDKTETRAIKNAFGEADAKKVHISSTKSMTGHMLGAAGAVEAIAAILAVQEDVIPPTINLKEADPACDLDYTPNTAVKTTVEAAMSTSLGFGGHNACVAFRKMRG